TADTALLTLSLQRRSSDLFSSPPGIHGMTICATFSRSVRPESVASTHAVERTPAGAFTGAAGAASCAHGHCGSDVATPPRAPTRSEEHTSELQSRENIVCR